MNLKHRVDKLERMRGIKDNPYLWDSSVYEDVPIVLEGVRYVAIEDVPLDVRKRHRNKLLAGTLTSRHGWQANVYAPDVDEPEPEQAAKSQESKQ